ncbi:MAG: cytochrome c biogenesis protein CcdA [Bacteroidota bacterium]
MKRIAASWAFILLLTLSAYAQVLKPAHWTYTISKPSVAIGEKVDLIFTATIDKDWYMYSSDLDPEVGPTPTTFEFKPNDTYQLVGKVKPIGTKKKYEKVWDADIIYFTGKAEFRQTVKVLKLNPIIEGVSDYQVCNDDRCITLGEEFQFKPTVIKKAENTVVPTEKATDGSASVVKPNLTVVAKTATAPDTHTIASAPVVAVEKAPEKDTLEAAVNNSPQISKEAAKDTSTAESSLTAFMIGAFLSGLLALLTPCVYPLIPMTVSFFTSQGGSRRKGITHALVYGFSIVGIYTVIGLLFSSIFGADSANFFSTHWIPNLLFFAIFLVFGMSFLGLFEIVLPSSLVNKVDTEADKGGLYGIFFMAFTLALVSFSCTGPIAGSLLIAASQGETGRAALGMMAYSMAFAVPFTLFAIFPSWLKSLPKSGGWLNSVKVVLGFLELALAMKFLSNADQVYHWGLLDRDVFLAIWIVLFALVGLYLLGKIRLPHDSELKTVSVPRLMFAIASFSLVVYLVPGLFGAPLKPLAGLLPPQTTQDFDLTIQNNSVAAVTGEPIQKAKYADFLKLPHGLRGFFDYKEGVAYAKKVGKPIFIDFTGHGCVNCREMEARVWSDASVLSRLKNDYVIISLYIDEKQKLPEAEWYTSSNDNRVKKTIGAQNADLQITRFGNNAQPYYCLIDPNKPDEKPLLPPIGYEPDVDKFVQFLDNGKNSFNHQLAQQ